MRRSFIWTQHHYDIRNIESVASISFFYMCMSAPRRAVRRQIFHLKFQHMISVDMINRNPKGYNNIPSGCWDIRTILRFYSEVRTHLCNLRSHPVFFSGFSPFLVTFSTGILETNGKVHVEAELERKTFTSWNIWLKGLSMSTAHLPKNCVLLLKKNPQQDFSRD